MNRLLIVLTIALLSMDPSTASAQPESILHQTIDSIMINSYPPDEPGAAIVVYQDHKMIFNKAYGLANLEKGDSNTTSTSFRIGSLTKQMTAICILKLASEHRLNLEDPISKYYPGLFPKGDTIRIKHLLSHTAGIKDLPHIPGIRDLMETDSRPIALITMISKEDLEFGPGEKYNYSNSGYVILGGVIETVSSLSYFDYLKTHVLQPIGMKNTEYAFTPETNSSYSTGYFTRPESYKKAPEVHHSLFFTAGGLWSTIDDMALWNEALYSYEVLDSTFLDMAFTPFTLNDGSRTDYGFGFRSCQVNGQPSIEHGGGVFGYSSYGIRIPENGVYVLILSNFQGENETDELAARIAAMTIGRPYNTTPETKLDPSIPIEGLYVTNDGDSLQVIAENEVLLIRREGKKDLPLHHSGSLHFKINESLDDVIFFKQDQNETSLNWKPRRSMAIEALKVD